MFSTCNHWFQAPLPPVAVVASSISQQVAGEQNKGLDGSSDTIQGSVVAPNVCQQVTSEQNEGLSRLDTSQENTTMAPSTSQQANGGNPSVIVVNFLLIFFQHYTFFSHNFPSRQDKTNKTQYIVHGLRIHRTTNIRSMISLTQ